MATFAHALPFGANLIADKRVRFRLFAPAQRSVSVDIEGAPSRIPMRKLDSGWFQGDALCGAGARYFYVLEDGTRVPDPASRAQAGDVHDRSIVVDPKAYSWINANWTGKPWPETVLYELHCGLFGGFRGVERELPRLVELGVTAIELMPIADFPGRRNWGYDGVLPFAPDASYGSPDDLKALVDAAHGLGLMVFLDVVYNHFGPDGNYIGRYAPSLFQSDRSSPWGAAIDFRLPATRQYFRENALYWLLEYRFDGLRLDAVHEIGEPDWLDELAAHVRAKVEPDRHVHLVLENDFNAVSHLEGGFDAQWNDDVHHALHVLLTGETEGYYVDYAEEPAAKLARGLSQGFIYQGEPSMHRGGRRRGEPSGALPPTAFVINLQNHDQVGNRAFGERLTALSDPEALEAATTVQLLAPQIPLIFMGEEAASRTPFLYFTDHSGDLANAVREGRRREFAKFANFADAKLREAIPDPNAPATFESSKPRPDPERGEGRGVLYRRLLALRRAEIVPRLKGAHALAAAATGPASVTASWRMGDAAILTIAVNLGPEPASIEAPRGRLLFESRSGAGEAAKACRLPGRSAVAFLEAAP
ncbi:MAG TPA: malto-oligosyltrehalose trehalohydrolase [Roseiarcus sp.]|jgi:malto-oligosyltrehalose trehalohydrolase